MIRSDRTFGFDADRDVVWAAVTRCDRYCDWWPWLRRFEPGDGFVEGAVWQCEVRPPTPWSLRFTITLEEVDPAVAVAAAVDGDIRGTASITLIQREKGGSAIRLRSDLAPASALLRAVYVAARPLAVWGHDWVLDQGVEQIRRKALPPPRGG